MAVQNVVPCTQLTKDTASQSMKISRPRNPSCPAFNQHHYWREQDDGEGEERQED